MPERLEPPPGDRVESARFVGGPWHGDAGRYYGFHAYPADGTPGGRYVFLDLADDGSAVYVFEHDDPDDGGPG